MKALDSIRLVVDGVPFALQKDKPVVITISRDMPRPETIQARVDLADQAFDGVRTSRRHHP